MYDNTNQLKASNEPICAKEPKHFQLANEISDVLKRDFNPQEQVEFVRAISENLRNHYSYLKEQADNELKRASVNFDTIQAI